MVGCVVWLLPTPRVGLVLLFVTTFPLRLRFGGVCVCAGCLVGLLFVCPLPLVAAVPLSVDGVTVSDFV